MHKAIIAKIDKVEEIVGANTIQIGYVLGERVVLSKDWGVGDIGILFPEGLQLSEDFCHHNNLYRDSSKNVDTTKKGFFENTRRVRSQPFMKVKSDAFFVGLSSISYCGGFIDINTLGHQFDEINGHKICEKYVSEQAKFAKANSQQKKVKLNLVPDFHKHVDTEQFKHYVGAIPKGALIGIHSKKHGSSHRQGYLPVTIQLPLWKRLVNKVINIFPTSEYQHVVGTRNCILDNGDKEGHHGKEQWRFDVAKQIEPHLTKGMCIYGEIVGFVNGKPIMPNGDIKALKDKAYLKKYGETNVYAYGCKEHEFKFHIYRITLQCGQEVIDFTDMQLKHWCNSRGFTPTLDVCEPFVYDGDQEALIKKVEYLTERPDCLTEDYTDPSHISEGVILRCDYGGLTPKFYKSKSYHFRVLEGMVEAPDEETIN